MGWAGLGWDGADKKSVRVSEAAVGDLAVHLMNHVLPFLESYQELCDLNEVTLTSSVDWTVVEKSRVHV